MNCCTGLASVQYKKRDHVSCMHVHGMEIIEFSFFDKSGRLQYVKTWLVVCFCFGRLSVHSYTIYLWLPELVQVLYLLI